MQAERRFEERHRAKVSKVMKDWSDLEEKYQEMRSEDPTSADTFKKEMTDRFQKTVQALEEESQAEKRQLLAMHQQRVISRINQRKKDAMNCYTTSLNKNPPITHRVQKCLQKLLRSMHKDRHHTIQHYRHLLEINFEQAEREREITIEHLADIDRLVNESLQMLSRYSELNAKILPLMEDYIVALRSRDNTPAPLLNMDREHEEQMMDNFRAEVQAKRKEKEVKDAKVEKEAIVKETTEVEAESTTPSAAKEKKGEDEEEVDEVSTDSPAEALTTEDASKTLKVEVHATAVHHERHIEPKISHAQAHDFSHNQGAYTVRRVQVSNSGSMYVLLVVAGTALLIAVVVGVVINRRRNSRYSHQQLVSKIGRTKDGFIEVDSAATPEEKHVAAMQINGYENPTYKYFETSTA